MLVQSLGGTEEASGSCAGLVPAPEPSRNPQLMPFLGLKGRALWLLQGEAGAGVMGGGTTCERGIVWAGLAESDGAASRPVFAARREP